MSPEAAPVHGAGGASLRVNDPVSLNAENPWLARFAKLVVALTFLLIFVGGHTTTTGAGMAFPDWPMSHGSFNPDGWWENGMQRLEHGHRYIAEAVGLAIGVLCAWVWRCGKAVPLAFVGAALVVVGAAVTGFAKPVVVHAGLWSAVVFFLGLLWWLSRSNPRPRPAVVRWLALAAFLGVCVQAVLGGLRVIHDPAGTLAGEAATANTLRVVHGCFAQIELGLLVAIATLLSPAWPTLRGSRAWRGIARLGWIAAAFLFLQLAAGATMRHLGAGLAIPTFPRMPDGGWLPSAPSALAHLNFTHTRLGAVVVTVLVIALAMRAFGRARGEARIVRPAALLLALVAIQFTLGLLVIWKMRPPILTTLHVVNGAALLATVVWLAVRASRSAAPLGAARTMSNLRLAEAHA
jgi:cytochrome c oxidase assembly protein subunit 15